MPLIHHLTLSVGDLEQSAQWLRAVLGPADEVERSGPGWRRVRMAWPDGLVIGVTVHEGGENGLFDHRRVGLDHLGLTCASSEEVYEWAARLEELGVEHGPVEVESYGWAVTARMPDGLPLEFFCPRR